MKTNQNSNGNGGGNGKLEQAANDLQGLTKEFTANSIKMRQVALEAIKLLEACEDLLVSDFIEALEGEQRRIKEELEAWQADSDASNQPENRSKDFKEGQEYLVGELAKHLDVYTAKMQRAALDTLYARLPELEAEEKEEQQHENARNILLEVIRDWPVSEIEDLAKMGRERELAAV